MAKVQSHFNGKIIAISKKNFKKWWNNYTRIHIHMFVCVCVNNNKVQENKSKIHFAESKMLDANIHVIRIYNMTLVKRQSYMDGKQISGYQGLGNWEAVD